MDCFRLVSKVFPERFEIRRIIPVEDRCLVDFVDREYRTEINCYEYCRKAEDWDRCVSECISSLERSVVSSVLLRKDGTVEEATITHRCEGLWRMGESDEEFKEKAMKIKEKFAKAECKLEPEDTSYIHPHDLAGITTIRVEKPAICYIHPRGEKCKIQELLKVL